MYSSLDDRRECEILSAIIWNGTLFVSSFLSVYRSGLCHLTWKIVLFSEYELGKVIVDWKWVKWWVKWSRPRKKFVSIPMGITNRPQQQVYIPRVLTITWLILNNFLIIIFIRSQSRWETCSCTVQHHSTYWISWWWDSLLDVLGPASSRFQNVP